MRLELLEELLPDELESFLWILLLFGVGFLRDVGDLERDFLLVEPFFDLSILLFLLILYLYFIRSLNQLL
jgi:hypothetical protein